MLRSALHRFFPSHIQNPLGLAGRLIRTRDPNARFAMLSAAGGLALTPLDLALLPFERQRYRGATVPERPSIFVCGPPRSGTTLLFQVLAATLPVAYFNNLTALFPRSPITANAWFGGRLRFSSEEFRSYYGRAKGLGAPNDALYLWDRWIGKNRRRVPGAIDPGSQEAMRRFFGAFERFSRRPLVAKNNNLNGYAHLVADVLPRAIFVCMSRDPLYLAQALYIARRDIHGDERVAYGIDETAGDAGRDRDPVDDVCRQVLFHQRLQAEQRAKIGPVRFRIVSYEGFCADPGTTIRELARLLGVAPDEERMPGPFKESRSPRLEAATLERMERTLAPDRPGASGSRTLRPVSKPDRGR
jgi:Sulfotransferase family